MRERERERETERERERQRESVCVCTNFILGTLWALDPSLGIPLDSCAEDLNRGVSRLHTHSDAVTTQGATPCGNPRGTEAPQLSTQEGRAAAGRRDVWGRESI